MVGNVHGSHTYAKSAAERVREHREDPNRNTSGFFSEDELRFKYLSSVKLGLWSPETYAQRGALVGWFDFSQQKRNEMNETRAPLLPRPSSRRVYHCMDWFTVDGWTELTPDRFVRSNWDEYSNSYYIQPDYLESSAPESVDAPDGQSGLDDFDCDASPCGYEEVRQCVCCLCPEGHKSVRARKDKDPTYVCNAPNCSWSGESPSVFPARRD